MKRSFTLSKLALVLSILLTTTSRPAFAEYNKAINNDVLNVREDIFVDSLNVVEKEANYYGNVTVNSNKGPNPVAMSMFGIVVDGDAVQFLGKTAVNVVRSFNPDYNFYQNVIGVYLRDPLPSLGDTQGKRVFKDLTITGHHAAFPVPEGEGPIYGIYYLGEVGNTDLSVQKLNIDLSGAYMVEGISLRDYSRQGTSKFRFGDVNMQLTGDKDTRINGFAVSYDTEIQPDGTFLDFEWDPDIVVNNINIQTIGGNSVTLLDNVTARFTGNVILGSQAAYDAANDYVAIYGSSLTPRATNIIDNNRFMAWGRMIARNNYAINIVTGDHSYFHGQTGLGYDQGYPKGTINLTLKGSNSRWDLVRNSELTNLTLKDSTLNFMHAVADSQDSPSITEAAWYKTLTIANDYHGDNGTIIMNANLGGDYSSTDKLVVKGSTSGITNVKVNNIGGKGAETINGIRLITVEGASEGIFKQVGRIVAGAYDYVLHKGNDAQNWYLSSKVSPPESELIVEPPPAPLPQPQPPQQPDNDVDGIRPEAALYGTNLAAANTLFNSRLHDRLGETHYVDTLTGEKAVTSMWLRNVGGHTRQRDSSGQMNIQSNRYVMQLGGDLAQWCSTETDRFHLGLMAGYANQKSRTRNQLTGHRARSTINGYSVGLYGTWLEDNDTYEGAHVDTWLQYSWFNNTVAADEVASEKYKSKGFTASVESGYTWKVAELSERSVLYVQPKAQVTWMGVKADDHREVNGTRVEGRGDGNIQTRMGVRLFGKGHNKLDDGNDRIFQPFVETNWIHNTKNFATSLDGQKVSLAGSRNIAEVKAGVEGLLTKNVALWGNIAQQVGNEGYSDASATLGVKASF